MVCVGGGGGGGVLNQGGGVINRKDPIDFFSKLFKQKAKLN